MPIIKPKKRTKKRTKKKKTIKELKEECKKKGKIYDPTKKKCRGRKNKTKKKTNKKATKKLIETLTTITKERSYSPTVNKELSRRDITPHKNLFGSCKDNQIKIDGKCLDWKNKKIEKYLLDNLKSKRKIKGEHIIGPKQNKTNCWFNTFFMCYFISDKARKFSKSFRNAMITGIIPTKKGKAKKIPDELRLPYWKLNKYITASLIGHKDPSLFMTSKSGNTNILIKEIYDLMKKYDPNTKMKQPGEYGNPRKMYTLILDMFKKKIEGKGTFKVTNYNIDYSRKKLQYLTQPLSTASKDMIDKIKKKEPHILGINLDESKYDQSSQDIGKKLVYKIGNLEYKLDSVSIRDIGRRHQCALLTINGEDYVYDGNNYTPLIKQKWRHLLNKDLDFKIIPHPAPFRSSDYQYNFKKSVLNMVYYRTK